jgi:hypothetical protein
MRSRQLAAHGLSVGFGPAGALHQLLCVWPCTLPGIHSCAPLPATQGVGPAVERVASVPRDTPEGARVGMSSVIRHPAARGAVIAQPLGTGQREGGKLFFRGVTFRPCPGLYIREHRMRLSGKTSYRLLVHRRAQTVREGRHDDRTGNWSRGDAGRRRTWAGEFRPEHTTSWPCPLAKSYPGRPPQTPAGGGGLGCGAVGMLDRCSRGTGSDEADGEEVVSDGWVTAPSMLYGAQRTTGG